MIKILLLLLLLCTNAFATVQVTKWATGTPVTVCQPSDSNNSCGSGGGGGGTNFWTGNNNFIYPATITNNVGIGTKFPGTILDVNGTVRMNGFIMPTGASSVFVLTSNGVGIGTWQPSTGGGGGSGNVGIGTVNRISKYIGTTTVGSPDNVVIVSGNLGVGTSGPSTLFDINRKFNVTSAGNVGVNNIAPGAYLSVQGAPTTAPVLDIRFAGDPYAMMTVYSPTGDFGAGGCNETAEYDIPDVNHFFQVTSCGNMIIKSTDPMYVESPGNSSYMGDGLGQGNNDYIKVDDSGANFSWNSDLGANQTNIDESGNISTKGGISSQGGTWAINSDGSFNLASGNFISDISGNARANSLAINGGSSSQFLKADASLDSSAYLTTTTAASTYVPYSSATGIVDLNNKSFVNVSNIGIGSVNPGSFFDVQGGARFLGAANNVGIGTVNPGQKLDVSGTIRATNFTLTSAATGCLTSTSGIITSTGSSCGGAGSLAPFTTDTTNVILAGGNIGIGTTDYSNNAQLYVFNKTNSAIARLRSDTSNTNSVIQFNSNGGTATSILQLANSGTANTTLANIPLSFLTEGDSSTTGGLVFDTAANAPIIFGTNGTATTNERMRIIGAGNIGIGTANPVGMVNIASASSPSLYFRSLSSSADSQIWAMINNSTTNFIIEPLNDNLTTIGSTAFTFTRTGNLGIGTTTPQGAFVVTSGNVGIGTWAPRGQLDVEGTLSAAVFGGNVGIGTTLTTTSALSVMNGNVGIGTWIPSNTLNIKGGVTVNNGGINLDNNQVLSLNNTGSSGSGQVYVDSGNNFQIKDNIAFTNMVYQVNGGSFQFQTLGNSNALSIGNNGISVFGANVGIGSAAPGQALDVTGTVRFSAGLINTKSSVGIGWSEHNATNQACNTTCGSSACVIGLDAGTVGVLNSNFVACADATADDCLCAGP